jgi:hypothetical protein
MPSNCSLNLFEISIILRNVAILKSLCDIDSVVIPKKMSFLKSIIQSEFKNLPIIEADKGSINSDCYVNDSNNDITIVYQLT